VAGPACVLRRCPRQIQVRKPRQPNKLFDSHLPSTSAGEGPVIGIGERIYGSTKLGTVLDVLIDQTALPMRY
jgi:hypothetical protein